MPSYYAACDVCVVPSRTKPLGRIVLEAMACQTVVAGAQAGGIPDHIREGHTGFVFPPEDVTPLAVSLRMILEQKTRMHAVARRALDHVQRELTWQHIARRIRDEVYRPVLAEYEAAWRITR